MRKHIETNRIVTAIATRVFSKFSLPTCRRFQVKEPRPHEEGVQKELQNHIPQVELVERFLIKTISTLGTKDLVKIEVSTRSLEEFYLFHLVAPCTVGLENNPTNILTYLNVWKIYLSKCSLLVPSHCFTNPCLARLASLKVDPWVPNTQKQTKRIQKATIFKYLQWRKAFRLLIQLRREKPKAAA